MYKSIIAAISVLLLVIFTAHYYYQQRVDTTMDALDSALATFKLNQEQYTAECDKRGALVKRYHQMILDMCGMMKNCSINQETHEVTIKQ